jgi:antitoxin component YwqK of YwqJK toxin-antitoxin module
MKNKQRVGLWIEKYSLDSLHYKSVGKYRKGDPVRRWRYYLNNKIIKREKYKRNTSITRFYHENGEIRSTGKSKLETSDKNLHWFYFGDWKYFNEEGKLVKISKYGNGELISEENFNKI